MTETVTAIDNPHAFPRDHRYFGHNGMTLRDWFAGQALAGIMARMEQSGFELGIENGDWTCPAGDAYDVAEAMLAERKNYK
jgi:uncharacterized protein YbjT (DUF2867 family)